MSVFDERPWGMRGTRQQREQQARAAEMLAAPANRGRKLGPPVDNGTVALAMSGMAFYWMMPMMMGKRRRRRKAAPQPPEEGSQEQA